MAESTNEAVTICAMASRAHHWCSRASPAVYEADSGVLMAAIPCIALPPFSHWSQPSGIGPPTSGNCTSAFSLEGPDRERRSAASAGWTKPVGLHCGVGACSTVATASDCSGFTAQ
jgi:hypothetical protein